MTDAPDYTTMSGAEFRRAVGADPEKWAEAFIQRDKNHSLSTEAVVQWFRDAMEAAQQAAMDNKPIGPEPE